MVRDEREGERERRDAIVIAAGEFSCEFMALLKYLTHAHRELCVTVLCIRTRHCASDRAQ